MNSYSKTEKMHGKTKTPNSKRIVHMPTELAEELLVLGVQFCKVCFQCIVCCLDSVSKTFFINVLITEILNPNRTIFSFTIFGHRMP